MNWLYVLALVFFLAGFVRGVNLLKSIRYIKHPESEITWQQPALSYWKYETPIMIALTINDLGKIGLAAFLIAGSINNNVFTFPPRSVAGLFLAISALLGIIYITHKIGSMLAFHFARQWIQPVSFGICSDGLIYGGILVDWVCYSHYEIGPDEGLISLYSSYSPSLRTWVLNPSAGTYRGVLEIIQNNLLPTPNVASGMSWRHSPFALILGITILNLGFLLPAIWGFAHDQAWVWAYALLAFLLIQVISDRIITTFDGRGK